MNSELYTKAVLTVIAVMLSVIAINQYVKPMSAHAASEQNHFAIGPNGYLYLYEEGTDVVKTYQPDGETSNVIHLGRH